jgi:hypothetical protein
MWMKIKIKFCGKTQAQDQNKGKGIMIETMLNLQL